SLFLVFLGSERHLCQQRIQCRLQPLWLFNPQYDSPFGTRPFHAIHLKRYFPGQVFEQIIFQADSHDRFHLLNPGEGIRVRGSRKIFDVVKYLRQILEPQCSREQRLEDTKSSLPSGPGDASQDAAPCRGPVKLNSIWLVPWPATLLCSQIKYFTSENPVRCKVS